MRRLFLILSLALASIPAFANPIDDECPHLTYGPAPVTPAADQYVCHRQYAVAYSYKTRNPVYTTEFLDKSHTGKLPRTNDFKVDPAIPKERQATPADYVKAVCDLSGGKDRCDKGHMTPDQDFSACAQCVHESFYMSNMVPQNFKNNEVIWKNMEALIRKYAATRPKGLYVISGPAYRNPAQPSATIGKNKVWVPDALFKIVIDAETGEATTFFMPNAPEANLQQFVMMLSVVEGVTGIAFDPKLDRDRIGSINGWK